MEVMLKDVCDAVMAAQIPASAKLSTWYQVRGQEAGIHGCDIFMYCDDCISMTTFHFNVIILDHRNDCHPCFASRVDSSCVCVQMTELCSL